MKRLLPVLLFACAAFAQTTPATRPVFTIGKDTTVIDGPLKADGTIDYIPAINALLGKDVKNEDNAALLLILVQPISSKDGTLDPQFRQIFEALHAKIPEKTQPLDYLSSYASQKQANGILPPEESQRLAELEDRLILRPWKRRTNPSPRSGSRRRQVLQLVEDASRRSKFFVPFCMPAEKSATGLDGSAIEAQPFISIFSLSHVLVMRAQMRTGAGDLPGALTDVRTIRNIARLSEQQHGGLIHLQSLAAESRALRACAGMAASGMLTRRQLDTVRQEILALPPIPEDDPLRDKVEQFISLDLAMQCIAGKSLPVMRLMALDVAGTTEFDLTDWKNANWDVMLRETVKLTSEKIPGDTYLESVRNWERIQAGEPQGPSFFDSIMSLADGGDLKDLGKAVNVFLKRRDAESRDAYTRRITRWLMGSDLSNVRRNLGLAQRPRTERLLALTAIALAEYRIAHGAYPQSLDKLAPVPEPDGFSGKPLLYRPEGDRGQGFKLWSVGMNQKDDGGKGDDAIVATEASR